MLKNKFSIQIGKWCFAPKLKIIILACLACACLVYLGFWQLHRAEYKKNLAENQFDRMQLTPVRLASMKKPSLHTDRFTPVIAEGVFLNNFTFLLDNQTFNKRPGYRVLTIFQAPRLEKWLLVDRGWIPRSKTRHELPEIKPVFGLEKIIGHVDTISTGITLVKDKPAQSAKYPIVIQALDYNYISEQINHSIYKFIVSLSPDDEISFEFPSTGVKIDYQKNIAYAWQWFTFAGILFIYFIIVSTKRKK